MQQLNHPNIGTLISFFYIHFLGYFLVRLLEIIENDDVICLVQEYANGGT